MDPRKSKENKNWLRKTNTGTHFLYNMWLHAHINAKQLQYAISMEALPTENILQLFTNIFPIYARNKAIDGNSNMINKQIILIKLFFVKKIKFYTKGKSTLQAAGAASPTAIGNSNIQKNPKWNSAIN